MGCGNIQFVKMRKNKFIAVSAYHRRFPSFLVSLLALEAVYMIASVAAGNMGGNYYLMLLEICLPPFFIATIVMSFFYFGAGILMAVSIGEGNQDECDRLYTLVITRLTAASAVLSVLGMIFAEPITYAFSGGASEELMRTAVPIVRISMLFAAPDFISCAMEEILEIYGHSRAVAIANVLTVAAGAVLIITIHNAAPADLRPYIFVDGIPSIQLLRAAVFLILKRAFRVPLHTVKVEHRSDQYIKMLRYGCSDAADDLLDEVCLIAVNWLLVSYLGAESLGYFVAVNSAVILLWFPFWSGGSCASPLLSSFYGMRDRGNLHRVTKASLKLAYFIGIAVNIAAFIWTGSIARLFGYTGGTGYDFVCMGLRIYCLFMPFYGLVIWLGDYYAATKHVGLSILFSAGPDSIIFPLMAAILMPLMKNKGIAFYLAFAGCYAVLILVWIAVAAVRTHSGKGVLQSFLVAETDIHETELMSVQIPISDSCTADAIVSPVQSAGVPADAASRAGEVIAETLRSFAAETAKEEAQARRTSSDEPAELRVFTDGSASWAELLYGKREHKNFENLTFGREVNDNLSYCYLYDFNSLRLELR